MLLRESKAYREVLRSELEAVLEDGGMVSRSLDESVDDLMRQASRLGLEVDVSVAEEENN